MIITFFLSVISSFVFLLLNILPIGNLPSGFTSGLAYLWSVVNLFSYLLPIDTLLQAVILVLSFDFAVLIWHFIQWVLRKIPFLHLS